MSGCSISSAPTPGVVTHVDSDSRDLFVFADSGAKQNRWAGVGAAREYDLVGDEQLPVDDKHAYGPGAIEDDAVDYSVREDREVRA